MSDHIAAVRAQAEKEAERLWPSYRTVGFSGADDRQDAFIRGAEWLASLLTREKIAEVVDEDRYYDRDQIGVLDRADAILALLVDDTQR